MKRLLVIGGGICGLAAADEALRQGAAVTLVERDATTGGMLSTDRREGFSFDRGGHRFITGLPWVLQRVRELVGDRLLLRTRRSLVFLDGTTVEYPLRFRDLMQRLGPAQNLRAVCSYLAATPSRWQETEPETLEQWLRPRFGRYLYERVFEGYSEKLWGRHPSEMSAEWAPQRISIPSLSGYLKELFLPSRRPPRTYAREYLYPRLGIGEIPESFERAIQSAGGTIRTGTSVRRLERVGNAWRAELEGEHAGREKFDGVVATISPPEVAGMLGGVELCDSKPLPNRGLRFLNLGFDRAVPIDATWIYQPDRQCRFSRIQIPAARSPEMVPPGQGSIQLEEPHSLDDDSRLDDRLREAEAALDALGLWLGPPTLVFESRAAAAYPIYCGGSRARARTTIDELERRPGLRMAGRQGRFDYIFFDRAIAQGVNAVRRLLGRPDLPERADRTATDRPVDLVEAQSLVGGGASATIV